jgi:hypothetical protein
VILISPIAFRNGSEGRQCFLTQVVSPPQGRKYRFAIARVWRRSDPKGNAQNHFFRKTQISVTVKITEKEHMYTNLKSIKLKPQRKSMNITFIAARYYF